MMFLCEKEQKDSTSSIIIGLKAYRDIFVKIFIYKRLVNINVKCLNKAKYANIFSFNI